ncbi:NtaA/DmoA family FMN-dependent monooxygenase [Gordonia humi]|uniref:FMN-dependent oxidoreductase (Nitrilotriacetate monooxygenase family) n=1 Tax=Gordonia humi TaxID=686429 RepID=A0A840F0S0_9ACTN|nr:NtaA/DmoA family FMN-dependent monooxygenase [Gordonia humi]MBB4134919.1 FMN-dependent oxidoreductase (nitrilotriacetate monooxygenase family) [Gordonia humi]
MTDSTPGQAKEIRLNMLEQCNPSFQAFGLWTHPRDVSTGYTSIDYWVEYAKMLERGLFDNFFLADVYGIPDVFEGRADGALKNGCQGPSLDPTVLLPAMAYATTNLCFTVTGSVTYEQPYQFARRFSTLDHMLDGRLGWNIVTSYLTSGAIAMGRDGLETHDTRYDIADEFLDGVYSLWEGSWDAGAVVRDKSAPLYVDPAKVRPVSLDGEHYRFTAIAATETSPQRTPVLFQAGTSSRGKAFAAAHAEGVYINGTSKEVVAGHIADFRKVAADSGRDPRALKFFMGISVFVDDTEQAAKDRHAEYLQYSSTEGLMAMLSGAMGIDLSQYPLDERIEFQENDSNRSVMEAMTRNNELTLRQALEARALNGTNLALVGSAEQVADELISWMDETDIDGFNIARIVNHETTQNFIDKVIPILQERGRYKAAYGEGTFRERLFGDGPHLPEDHPAAQKRQY